MKTIRNESDEIAFIDIQSGFAVPTEDALRPDRLSSSDFEACVQNGLNELRFPGEYVAITGLAALPPGTEWAVSGNGYRFVRDLCPTPIPPFTSRDAFIEAFRVFASSLPQGRVAVELSGGLDSSLLTELLCHVGLEPILIGFSSDRYEFRTERAVQRHYLERFPSSAYLLRYEDCPAFARLDEAPLHPLPSCSSHFFARHETVARFAATHGVSVVLSGEAGDQLLGHKPPNFTCHGVLPPGYSVWSLSEMWSDQFVFRPHGVEYLSGFATPDVAASLVSLRGSQDEDLKKWWARAMFRDLLPESLSDYAYCAAHDGWVVTGLTENAETIQWLTAQAYEKIPHPLLEAKKMQENALNYGSLSPSERALFLSTLSFVVWVNSLARC